ncbi:MAG: hypothetical protein A2051_05710 [Desulfovibrionales bacterium GWA2_65_9]|nr:MAG: hypothetical protein A2051_05710 [Desulfovibrionales bacterium GWA2_65_9]
MKFFRNAASLLAEMSGLVPVLAAYAALVHFHPQLGLAPLLYMAYAAAFILLPAYACALLLPQKDLGLAERVCLGFPLSQALLFLLAWGGSRLGLSWWGALGLPALGLFGLCDLSRARSQGQRSEPFFLIATAAITTLSLILCFRYFLQAALPGEGAEVFTYGDDSFVTMGTFSAVKSLLSGGPFMEGRFGDIPFPYHIMLQANNGVAHLVTGIHPLPLQLYLYPVLHWFLLAGAVVAGARRFAGFDRTAVVLAACLLLYASGFLFEATPWFQMYGTFHTYFYSLPGSILLGMLLFGVLSQRLAGFPGAYFSLLFFAVCAAKGVPLVLVPLSLLPVLAYRLCQRKLGLADLKVTVGVVLSGLVLRLIEYTSLGQLQLKKFNVLNSALELSANALEYVPFVLLVGLVAMSNRLTKHELLKSRQYIIFVAAMFVVCMTLTRTVDFVGGQQYFFWYFRIFLLILIASYCGYALKLRKRTVRLAVVAVVTASVSVFLYSQYQMIIHETVEKDFSLNKNESKGLLWAYDHLDHRARIITNGAYSRYERNGNLEIGGPVNYLAVSGLSGYAWPYPWLPDDIRRIVDPRLAVVNAFWKATSVEEQQRLLADIPVDYLFVRKREDRGLDYTGLAGVRRVYSNEDFDIYALWGTAPQNERTADRAL